MKEVNKRNPERCLCRNILEDLRKLKFNFKNISMNKKKKKTQFHTQRLQLKNTNSPLNLANS